MGDHRSTKSVAKKSTAAARTKVFNDMVTEKQQRQDAELSDQQLEGVSGGCCDGKH